MVAGKLGGADAAFRWSETTEPDDSSFGTLWRKDCSCSEAPGKGLKEPMLHGATKNYLYFYSVTLKPLEHQV